ncbi:Delphilin, partial [Nosema granulosis]
NTNTTQPTTRKKIIKKKKDAKKINYIPIKLNKIPKEGTIFEDTKKIIFTEKELEVFEKKEVVRKKQEVVKKKEGIFPEKKNYALNILLSRIKLTDRNLKKLVLEGGDCDPNLVKQLLLYFPTEDELEKLGKIEQNLESERSVSFFRECLPEIEDVKNSLRLIFFRTLLDSACSYSPHLSTLSLYYSKILSSTALRDILSFVLSLGNILNPSQCEAFSLDSLSQILESQSIISLLRQKVDLDLFREDFKIILDIQRINFQSISLDFQELSAAYSEIKDIDSETKDTYKQIDSQYQNTLKTYSQAQNYLKEKIDEDFNREFLNIFLKLSVERCTKKEM